MQSLIQSLVEHMKTLPVIDAHSHLAREQEMLCASEPDVFTRIFTHYSLTSAETSGMVKRSRMRDTSIPLSQRWEEFKPCLAAIRETGYVRAALRTAKEYYGVEDVNDESIDLLQGRIISDCTLGQYDRVFDFCKIEKVINQHTYNDTQRSVSVSRAFMCLLQSRQMKEAMPMLFRKLAGNGLSVSSLEGFFMSWFEDELKKTNMVGVKMMSNFFYEKASSDAASEYAKCARSGLLNISDAQADMICTWLRHRLLDECGRRGLVVAVHCGINWCCSTEIGESFYNNDPKNIMPWVISYPKTVFDLYHAGIPWVREIAVIANQCPNVNLNLVWAYQIAPEMTVHFLSEWLDIVPLNKIIGFGGDSTTPEKTVGALSLARECIARALAVRVASHEMTESRASEICRDWLYENPKRIYKL